MIRTTPTVVPALQFKVGDVVAFNTQRWQDETGHVPNGTYHVKIKRIRQGRAHTSTAIQGEVVYSENGHFRVGSLAGFFDTRHYDLVPVAPVKAKRARLEKFTVFGYDGGRKVMAKNAANAKKNLSKETGYSADSFHVYAGHLVELRD